MLSLGNERLKISEQRQTSGCSYLIFFSIFKVILSKTGDIGSLDGLGYVP